MNYEHERLRAHKRWYRIHMILAFCTLWTLVGPIIFGFRGRHHRKKAREYREELKTAE